MISTALLLKFPGARKTTLLNRLIAHFGSGRRALVRNEFGQAGIGGQLLREDDYELVVLNQASVHLLGHRYSRRDNCARATA